MYSPFLPCPPPPSSAVPPGVAGGLDSTNQGSPATSDECECVKSCLAGPRAAGRRIYTRKKKQSSALGSSRGRPCSEFNRKLFPGLTIFCFLSPLTVPFLRTETPQRMFELHPRSSRRPSGPRPSVLDVALPSRIPPTCDLSGPFALRQASYVSRPFPLLRKMLASPVPHTCILRKSPRLSCRSLHPSHPILALCSSGTHYPPEHGILRCVKPSCFFNPRCP